MVNFTPMQLLNMKRITEVHLNKDILLRWNEDQDKPIVIIRKQR